LRIQERVNFPEHAIGVLFALCSKRKTDEALRTLRPG
jgi:hypothetical protein